MVHPRPEPPRFPQIVRQGVDGCVVRFSDKLTEAGNRAALAFQGALAAGEVAGVEEAASALASVYVRFASIPALHEGVTALERLLAEEDFYAADLPGGRRLWTIPAVFGGAAGPQLDDVAASVGVSRATAIETLTNTRMRVLATGFAPGQPYLGELPEAWNLPRLGDLIDVPEGALVVAIRQVVLFANASPTGWQHVGQTAFRVYRPENTDRPFPLAPGDEVCLRGVEPGALNGLREGDGGATWEALP
ncbi:5-oxoprolinase subunit B family protein [Ovoidimarina sediminis]|uniref:5-oxoprolinase subunit B family protein n=1 Tax=Ovoidimarina sediminis TaxID=3079856 RepID=UPI00290986BA|nr:carboxyltransferase domain-containing protein [Rhodophyticola sp. MJ-SS7]MDU8945237.1 carboxyltransferase domain-containing protein [Rhodophyticola sp. MJ-SS7]